MLRNFTRIFHWGPLFALSIIAYISTVGFFATLLWWPPLEWWGQLNLGLYLTHIPLILFSFLRAMMIGPGFVPLGWRPQDHNDQVFLQYCAECDGYKPPRSHHCRRCKRCVMKMDHHCPWINTCCGHLNHFSFISFLIFVPIGCLHAAVILICCAYRTLYRSSYQQYIFTVYRPPFTYSVPFFFATMLAAGLAVAVVCCVTFLFILQLQSVLRNQTGIESYICEKAQELSRPEDSSFVYPYDFGSWKNLVLFWQGGNGFDWPVKPGCSKYDLTVEQKMQKEAKRERTIQFEAVTAYSGSIFPVSFGFGVLFGVPITDEPRMKLSRGDIVMVTRGKSKWLYGHKAPPPPTGNGDVGVKTSGRDKGWFPRECVQRSSVSMFEKFLCPAKKDL